MVHNKTVHIIGVPMDLGAGRRGVDMGPAALRVAGLGAKIAELGYDVMDCGNIFVEQVERLRDDNCRAHYLSEISNASLSLAEKTRKILDDDGFPIVLGGDHSIAIGSVSGISAHFQARREKIGIIWLDAHADMNTPETTNSGNIHGMPLASLMGRGLPELTDIFGYSPKVDPANVALIGIRDIDPGERALIKELGVRAFSAREMDERGMNAIMDEALDIASRGTAGYHVTLDVDFIDPRFAPGVGTPVPGGATYRESHLAMERIADHGAAVSLEYTELNPIYDVRNQSAEVGVELLLSALGKSIL
ncbi:MAG TPA: arginase [Blastocatellia bacterium]|nr:arginase [Blastocatellia bacterium]